MSTLYRAVSQGNHGVQSPSKKGPQAKIPDVLVEVVATMHKLVDAAKKEK